MAFRKALKLTQLDISKKTGYAKSYICEIENGAKNPSYRFIKRFFECFPHADIVTIFFL